MQDDELNPFEKSVLEWIGDATANAELSAQIQSASLKRRDYMRTGFFIYLESDQQCAVVEKSVRASCPRIFTQELFDGAGCNLFLKNGRLHYLEIYARGGFLPQTIEQFRLSEEVD